VLDLGGGDGTHIHALLEGSPVESTNTYVADIDADAISDGAARHGFTPVVIPETGRLPFSERFFDIVFCSSVLEHVTVPKEIMWNLTSGSRFRSIARQRQRESFPGSVTCRDPHKSRCCALPTGFGSSRQSRIFIFLPKPR
jgi:hypothetical protein